MGETRVSTLIGYCGLDCAQCHSYIATRKNDVQGLEKIAETWGTHDNMKYSVNDVRCHGCNSDVLNKNCNICEIRGCGKTKNLLNCGECIEFVCDKLQGEWDSWIDADPEQAKRNLTKQ